MKQVLQTNLYLLDEMIQQLEDRADELCNLSLEQYLNEYYRICKAENAIRQAEFLLDNIGWIRHEDNSRKYVYSRFATEQFNKEAGYSNRANGKKNTVRVLADQKLLIMSLAADKYGYDCWKKFGEIDEKCREEFNAFWDSYRNNQ